MPFLYLLSILAQILLSIHAWKSGRERTWIYIILIFPGVGSILYIVVELLPALWHGAAGQAARKRFDRLVDPDRDLRAARHAFETAPTVANRLNLAQMLITRRDYDAAIAILQPGLADNFADDPMLLEGLAYAHFYKGDYGRALDYAERICSSKDAAPKDYVKLLRARLYQETGALQQAEQAFTELVKTWPGEEARICLAQFYQMQNRHEEARAIYQDVVARAPHAPRHYQQAQREWIDQARAALRKIGG